MPTFSGIVTDYANKAKSFNFRVNGVKYTFKGNNVHGIKDGDGVTGSFKEETFVDQATGKSVKWNSVVELSPSSTAAANAPVPVAKTATNVAYKATGHQAEAWPFPVPADSYQRSVLRRDCVRDAVAALVGKGDKPEPSAVITYAKELEAYVSGTADVAKAKSAIEKLTETEED